MKGLTDRVPPFIPTLLLFLPSACAATTTQLAQSPPGAVESEEQKQRLLALIENEQQQARLDNIVYTILVMGTPLCPNDKGPRLGARFATIHNYESAWRPAARRALGLGDTLAVLSVIYGAPAARAGLRPGDQIVAVGTTEISGGAGSVEQFTALSADYQRSGNEDLSVVLVRDGQQRRASIHLDEVCDYGSVVVQSSEMNAYADGKTIYVTSAMMRLVDNDALRVLVAHEFAHNARGHLEENRTSTDLEAMTFSQDLEQEADYVGLYALTLADLPIDAAPRFWRHMAKADPQNIGFAHTHPTTAERFVRMEQSIAEIEQKIATKQPLEPDHAGTPGLIQAQEAPVAQAPSGATGRPPGLPVQHEGGSADIDTGAGSSQGYAPPPAALSSSFAEFAEAAPDSQSPGELHPSGIPEPESSGEIGVSGVLEHDPQVHGALNEVVRLGMVTEYREARPGLLVLTIGPGFTRENAAAFHLGLLHEAYSGALGMGETAIFELWRGGSKVGEYTHRGLILTAN
jgi:beta-barrel assembly-enhancing protease